LKQSLARHWRFAALLALTSVGMASGTAAPLPGDELGKATAALKSATVLPANELAEARAALTRAADAILRHQQPDGAIVMGETTRPPLRVSPYFANLAALGLARAYHITRDIRHLQAARRWLDWYIAHLNPDATIYDYTGTPQSWVSTGIADSTDSYAATFLDAAWEVYRATDDAAWRRQTYGMVARAVAAIRLTQQPTGLTTAKPDYPVIYTMDNAEVYRGWMAAKALAGTDFDHALTYTRQAEASLKAIREQLWRETDAGNGHYLVGLQTDGAIFDTKQPMVWYPDEMAQLMAIAWLPPDARHHALWGRLRGQVSKLPRAVATEGDLERLVWWTMAAQAVEDSDTTRALLPRLIAFDGTLKSVDNVALYGHLCRVLEVTLVPHKPVF